MQNYGVPGWNVQTISINEKPVVEGDNGEVIIEVKIGVAALNLQLAPLNPEEQENSKSQVRVQLWQLASRTEYCCAPASVLRAASHHRFQYRTQMTSTTFTDLLTSP